MHNVYIDQASTLKDDDDKLPRDFVDQKQLQNLKYRQNRLALSPLQELFVMSYTPESQQSIKKIVAIPFQVLFWSNEQKHIYTQLGKSQKLCISIDATGGLVSNNSFLNDVKKHLPNVIPKQPHIFLYLICVKNIHGSSIPVGKILSADQSSLEISYFLQKWRKDFENPNEIVCDDSPALLKAITLACTLYRL